MRPPELIEVAVDGRGRLHLHIAGGVHEPGLAGDIHPVAVFDRYLARPQRQCVPVENAAFRFRGFAAPRPGVGVDGRGAIRILLTRDALVIDPVRPLDVPGLRHVSRVVFIVTDAFIRIAVRPLLVGDGLIPGDYGLPHLPRRGDRALFRRRIICVVIARHITQAALQLRLRRNVAGRVVGVGDTVPLRITDRFQPRFPVPLRVILLVY